MGTTPGIDCLRLRRLNMHELWRGGYDVTSERLETIGAMHGCTQARNTLYPESVSVFPITNSLPRRLFLTFHPLEK